MPTGYTAPVQSGDVVEFPEFAMRCARAMGALIMMRDSATDAQIPEAFEPSDYHVLGIEEAKDRLMSLRSMSVEDVHKEHRKASEAETKRDRIYDEGKKVEAERYRAMLEKVGAWTPPTDEHAGLKEFMEEQLRTSIDHDCGDFTLPRTTPIGADEWFKVEVRKAEKELAYHQREDRTERERTDARNVWIRELRDSLKKKEGT